MRRVKRAVPVVVRFAGNNADFARVRLKSSGVVFADARDLTEAMELVMAALPKGGA